MTARGPAGSGAELPRHARAPLDTGEEPVEPGPSSRLNRAAGMAVVLLVLGALAAAGARGLPERAADRGPAPISIDGAAVAEVIAWALILLGIAGLVFVFWPSGARPKLPPRPKVSPLRFLVLVALIAVIMSIFRLGLLDQEQAAEPEEPIVEEAEQASGRSGWAIALLVASLLAALGVLAIVGLRRPEDSEIPEAALPERRPSARTAPAAETERGPPTASGGPAQMEVIRRYGAMLDDLEQAGYGRQPSEAPLEYLDRIAATVTFGDPARRLTGLFEVAGFSAHPATDEMIVQADEALSGVRSELEGSES